MRLALVQEVQTAIPDCVVHAASNLETAVDLIAKIAFEMIVVDPGLPGHEPGSAKDRLKVIATLQELCPTAIHIVVTSADSQKEGEEFRKLGVAAYISKNHLRPRSMGAILDEIAENGFSIGLVHPLGMKSEIYHAALSGREQEVLASMLQTPSGISRRQVYEQLAERMNIDPASAERYYKRAKAKLLKYGHPPTAI